MDLQVIKSLGLTRTGSIPIHTPSTGTTPHNTDLYDVFLYIPFSSARLIRSFPNVPVAAADLAPQGLQALIGRDILGKGLLIYDGAGTFVLAF